MAKGIDPFEKFKAATLSGSPSIKSAISSEEKASQDETPAQIQSAPSPALNPSIRKNVKANESAQEQVSFFIDKKLKKAVGLLKYELDVQLKDLYEEAIRDLLKKYHKL